MKKSCLIIIGVFLSYYAFAQNIQGIQTGTSFSTSTNEKIIDKSKVIQIFGVPDETRHDIGDENEECWDFYYNASDGKTDCLAFCDGQFVFYGLRSPRFLVATDMFDGGIQVGDSLSKALNAAVYWENYNKSSDPSQVKLIYSYGTFESRGQTHTFIRVLRPNDDSFLMLEYSGNTITYIEFDYNR